jgi:hypothetical protein
MGRKSAKKIEKLCELCGSGFIVKDTKRERIKRFCSSYCAKRFNGLNNKGKRHSEEVNKSKGRSGEENAFYGKAHTDKTKKLISEKNTGKQRTKETKEKLSKQMTGVNNPFYGKTHDMNFRTKQSKMMKQNNPNNLEHVRVNRSISMLGKNNPAWMGGVTSNWRDYSGKFTNKLKLEIKSRDNFTCIICNNYGNIVHHIDYNKHNNTHENLTTVCNSCHGKTNWNRSYWEILIKEKSVNE